MRSFISSALTTMMLLLLLGVGMMQVLSLSSLSRAPRSDEVRVSTLGEVIILRPKSHLSHFLVRILIIISWQILESISQL